METDTTPNQDLKIDSPDVAGCPAPVCCAAWLDRRSKRARSALVSLGVKTFDDVVRVVNDGSFASVPGVGVQSYNDVLDDLWGKGFDLIYAPKFKPGRAVKKWNFDPITGKPFQHNTEGLASTAGSEPPKL